MKNSAPQINQAIKVLELRNYLLKPNTLDEFGKYFSSRFEAPMNELGGYTLGKFNIRNVSDRFVWFRGFADMQARVKFLNDFYINSVTWKKFGPGANNMMINSDNVYLLKPLTEGVTTDLLATNDRITVVDFYICNSTLDKVIDLFNKRYIEFLKTLNINNTTLWVSEMRENDFPRLPVFQDKNLLVQITNYATEKEYEAKKSLTDQMDSDLKKTIQEIITTESNLLLLRRNYN
jgi:hypothetical protein